MRLLIGISGASGVIYAIRLLQILGELGIETHLVITKTGEMTIGYESELTPSDLRKLAGHWYPAHDLGAACSSGSFLCDGMIVAPCSMRTLGEIATGITSHLLSRSADVCLKERRRLVLMVRETPFNLSHLEHMAQITRMGGIIAPPVPAFYNKPDSIDAMVNQTVARTLALFGIEVPWLKRWRSPDGAKTRSGEGK
ncbi:MAG: UbiX family flavin prenyltransferase [Pseudomonadota bacterium]